MRWTIRVANGIQGTFVVQLDTELFAFKRRAGGADCCSLLGRVCYDLDRICRGDFANKAAGRKHVSLCHSSISNPANRNRSFFQSVGIIGYTLFPLVIAGILSSVGLYMIARIPIYIVLVAWSLAAGISILGGSGVIRNRVGIAVYPLLVFYVGLGALCFIT